MRVKLCLLENGESHRGLKEFQINLRVAQTQKVSAAKGYGRGPIRSARSIRPYFCSVWVVAKEVRELPGPMRDVVSHVFKSEVKRKESAISAAARKKEVRIKYYRDAYICDAVK